MAKRWLHWVRVVHEELASEAEAEANRIMREEDFDVVVPRISTAMYGEELYTTILLAFRKQVDE